MNLNIPNHDFKTLTNAKYLYHISLSGEFHILHLALILIKIILISQKLWKNIRIHMLFGIPKIIVHPTGLDVVRI